MSAVRSVGSSILVGGSVCGTRIMCRPLLLVVVVPPDEGLDFVRCQKAVSDARTHGVQVNRCPFRRFWRTLMCGGRTSGPNEGANVNHRFAYHRLGPSSAPTTSSTRSPESTLKRTSITLHSMRAGIIAFRYRTNMRLHRQGRQQVIRAASLFSFHGRNEK